MKTLCKRPLHEYASQFNCTLVLKFSYRQRISAFGVAAKPHHWMLVDAVCCRSLSVTACASEAASALD